MSLTILYGEAQTIVDALSIKSCTISTSLTDIFLTATLRLLDIRNLWSGKIKIGDPITLQHKLQDSTIVNKMRVLSYSKTSEHGSATMDNLVLQLIDSRYFQQRSVTAAYEGPVSSIIGKIAESYTIADALSIEAGNDTAIIRYRSSELEGDFIKRIAKYATADNSPMYCFADHRGTLHLKSTASMLRRQARYTLVSLDSANANPKDMVPQGSAVITMYALAFSAEGNNASSVDEYRFATKHVQYSETALSSMSLETSQKGHSASAVALPQKTTSTYGWEMPFFDGVAYSAHKTMQQNFSLFNAVAVTSGVLTTPLCVGDLVAMRLQKGAHIHNAEYLIIAMSHTYSEEGEFCRMELWQPV